MTSTTSGEIQLRVICRSAPEVVAGAKTELGLQDKKKQLVPGVGRAGDKVAFTASVTLAAPTAKARFRGSFVHGPADAQHLYIGWREVGAEHWLNRLKVALALTDEQVQQALTGGVLEAYGTVGAWGELKDWHGLGVGQTWRYKKR